MIRSLRWGCALMLLAQVGLASAQSTSPPSTTGRSYTISVQVPGNPAQVCQIVKMWNEADGSRAYQVQALDTGELMTVLEKGAGSSRSGGSVVMQVFRWGRSATPPAGTPTPPADAVTLGTPATTTVARKPVSSPVANTSSQPHSAATAMPSAPTTLVAPEAPISGAPTILPPAPATTATLPQTTTPAAPVAAPQVAAPVTPAPVPVQAALPPVPVVTNPAPVTPAPVTAAPVVNQSLQEALPPEVPMTTVAKPTTVTTPVSRPTPDWRDSWSSVENKPVPAPVPTPAPQPVSVQQPGTPGGIPVARNDADDPLRQPAAYSKNPEKANSRMGIPLGTPAALAAAGPATLSKTTVIPMPSVPSTRPTPVTQPIGLSSTPPAPAPIVPNATTVANKPVEPTPAASPILNPLAAVNGGTTPQQCVPCPVCPPSTTTPATKTAAVSSTAACVPCQTGTTTVGRLTPTPVTTPVVCEPKKPTPVATPVVTKPRELAPMPTPVVKTPVKLTPTPAPVVAEPKKPTPTPTVSKPVKTEEKQVPTANKTSTASRWNPFGGPTKPVGMRSVTAAGARELLEDPQPVVIAEQGRPLVVTPPTNAFGEAMVMAPPPQGMGNAFTGPNGAAPQPIPMDRIRKDLMPPELVALMERQQRDMAAGRPTLPLPPFPGAMPSEATVTGPVPTPGPSLPTAPTPGYASVQQVSGNAALEQLRATIADGLLPSEREMAADQLAKYDPIRTPAAVSILLSGAKSDPATTVRVACVRAIGQMGARSQEVLTTLETVAKDSDPQVKQAATDVLALIRSR